MRHLRPAYLQLSAGISPFRAVLHIDAVNHLNDCLWLNDKAGFFCNFTADAFDEGLT